MEHQSLYSNSNKPKQSSHNTPGTNTHTGTIKESMTAKEIGNIISNRLISHVDKAIGAHKKK